MAVYATREDAISLYGGNAVAVASDHNTDSEIDDSVIDKALEAASADIDQFITGGGQTPPATAPDAPGWFKWACVDIAMYMLSPDGAKSQEEWKVRTDYWRGRLMAIYQPTDINGNPITPSVSVPTSSSRDREFTRVTMGGLL